MGSRNRPIQIVYEGLPQYDGPACLCMILGYFGKEEDLVDVGIACEVDDEAGVNANQIVEAARSYGLVAEGMMVGNDALSDLPLPAILHWDFGHFVVLEDVAEDGVHIIDPAVGRLVMSPEHVTSHFTGVVLLFCDPEDVDDNGEEEP